MEEDYKRACSIDGRNGLKGRKAKKVKPKDEHLTIRSAESSPRKGKHKTSAFTSGTDIRASMTVKQTDLQKLKYKDRKVKVLEARTLPEASDSNDSSESEVEVKQKSSSRSKTLDRHMLPDTAKKVKRKQSQEEFEEPDDSVSVEGHTEASGSDDEDEYAGLKKELSNIPFEDLQKLKEKLGLKKFNSIIHGDSSNKKKKMEFKRVNSNRPREMSSKRPVSLMRQHDVPKQKAVRDPRFDDLSGTFNEVHFNRDYSFLTDISAREREKVAKNLKKEKNAEKRKSLQALLRRMTQQEATRQQKQRHEDLERQLKQKERDLVKEGKTPFFLKKSERRKLELAEKFKELKKTGKMEKYLTKKRKKNAQKERKKMKFH